MEGEDSRIPTRIEDKLKLKSESGQGETRDAVLNEEKPTRPAAIRIFPQPTDPEIGFPPNLLTEPGNVKKLNFLKKGWNFDENSNYVRKKKFKNFRFLDSDSAEDSADEEEKLYGKYLEPRPSKWLKSKQFLGYLFFWPRSKYDDGRLVRFPSEVVEKAKSDQQHGETMGKFREVRRSTKHRQKLSSLLVPDRDEFMEPSVKTYRVLSKDLPFPPDEDSWLLRDNPPDSNCCPSFCGRKETKKAGFTPAEEKRKPPAVYSDKFKVTEQKLGRTLDVVEDFTVGNLKTINYTLGVIGIAPLPEGPEGDEEDAETKRFNHIAAGVWFFTFAIEELFQNEADDPTKAEFEELLNEFTNLAVVADRVARRTVIFSQLHSAFGETAMTRLRSATNRLHIHSPIMDEFKIREPAQLGHALQIQSQSRASVESSSTTRPQPSFKIVTRPWFPISKPHAQNPWLPFSRQPKSFKLDYLKEFLTKLQHRMMTLNVQMRFLTDDIFERNVGVVRGKKRKLSGGKRPKEQTFLSALYSLDVVMYRFSVFKETTPKYERALMATMEAVATDTYELIAKGEQIIDAIVEVRDMVELSVSYMAEAYGIDFEGLIPNDVQFNSKGSTTSCHSCWRKFRCAFSDDLVEASPGFNPSDFFNTIFPFYLQKRAMLHRKTEYEFALKPARDGDKKRSKRIVFSSKDAGNGQEGNRSKSISAVTLGPAVGVGSVWDDLSRVNIFTLKEQVIGTSPDPMDIKPSIVTEILRREAFNSGN